MHELLMMQGMNENQKLMFMSEFGRRRKSGTTGILLALLLGGVGAHRFYLGHTVAGVLYLMFFWTFIPGIIAFFEIFMMSSRVERHNQQQAFEVAAQVKALLPATT